MLLSTCVVAGMLVLAISGQSLWIDEGLVARLTAENSIGELFAELGRLTTSDPQMPLYLVYMWLWTGVFGIGEIALRASNIPFAIVLAFAMSWTACRLWRRPSVALLAGTSPFLCFYMNEARPYMPVIALSAVSLVAVEAYVVDRDRHGARTPWICLTSFLVLCAIYMLGVFLGVALAAMLALEARRRDIPRRAIVADWKWPVVTHAVLFLPLGAYYLTTLLRGSGGTRGQPGLGNLAFAAYEFLGFAGLGPPRHVLRASPEVATLVPHWPWLCLGGLACLGLAFAASTVLRVAEHRAELASWAIALTASGVLLTAAALAFRFEFWGRHWAPLFPAFLLGVARLLSLDSGDRWFRFARNGVLVLIVSAWGVSDLRLRFMPSYAKDDYRLAAGVALSEASVRGATVVWVADVATAQYYGIEAERDRRPGGWPVRGRAVFAANWNPSQVETAVTRRVAPLIVVLSKPDLYDRHGAWRSAIELRGARRVAAPNAFEIYLVDHE